MAIVDDTIATEDPPEPTKPAGEDGGGKPSEKPVVDKTAERLAALEVENQALRAKTDKSEKDAAGAQAYVLKTATAVELVETVRAVRAGLRRLSRAAADRMSEYPIAAHLTPRELDVIRLLARGFTNKEIGAALEVSETTVKWFVKNILQKLGVNDRTAAVTTALERGILHPR